MLASRVVLVSLLVGFCSACAISSELDDAGLRADAGHDVPLAIDAPAEPPDVGVVPIDVGVDSGPLPSGVRHLLLLHWPAALVEWTPRRTPRGFSLGPSMVGLRHEDLALITGLVASPPVELYDTHVDVPPSLWTGSSERAGSSFDGVFGAHPSLDVVVASWLGGEPFVSRSVVRPYDTYAPALSWTEPRAPSPLVLDARTARLRVPCATRPFPELGAGSRTRFEDMTGVVSEQIRFAVEGFENGCLHAAGLELGDASLVFMDQRVRDVMHDTDPAPIAAVIDALSRWLAEILAELADAGVLDHTLVVLTTEQGGDVPGAHLFRDMPIFLWSRASNFRPGWIEADRRPVRDWLTTVARAFGADGTFAADLQPPGVAIEGLFVD